MYKNRLNRPTCTPRNNLRDDVEASNANQDPERENSPPLVANQ